MVSDKHNKIYTELLTHIREYYPKLQGGTPFRTTKSGFPFMSFQQIDGSTRLTTLSNTEEGINLAFQIDVYTDGDDNQARNIANLIREYMIGEGFRCRTFRPMEADSNVSRFITRFERLDV